MTLTFIVCNRALPSSAAQTEPFLDPVSCLTLTAAAADDFTSTTSCVYFYLHSKPQLDREQYKSDNNRAVWFSPAVCVIRIMNYLPFSLSTYRLWHSFSILSLGVVMADSRGFATDRGFLPDIMNDRLYQPSLFCFNQPGEGFRCCTHGAPFPCGNSDPWWNADPARLFATGPCGTRVLFDKFHIHRCTFSSSLPFFSFGWGTQIILIQHF